MCCGKTAEVRAKCTAIKEVPKHEQGKLIVLEGLDGGGKATQASCWQHI